MDKIVVLAEVDDLWSKGRSEEVSDLGGIGITAGPRRVKHLSVL